MSPDHGRGESGQALVLALLGTMIIAGLVTVMMGRTVMQNQVTTSARDRETAIHIAEGGIDHVVAELNDDERHVTTTPTGDHHEFAPSTSATLAEQKDWALALAADPDACVIVVTEGGEACAIRPFDDDGDGTFEEGEETPFIFGVGFVPSRENAEKTRVVKVQFDKGFFSPEKAILTNGDLRFSSTVCGNAADVHTNGDIELGGGADTTSCADPDGNVTASGTYSANGDVGPNSGHVDRTETIPQVRAETVYENEAAWEAGKGKWFDLCPDGTVRTPNLDGSGELVRDSTTGRVQPCTGEVKNTAGVTYNGWLYDEDDGHWETEPRIMPGGVYYAYERNVWIDGELNEGEPVNMTVLADAEGDIVGQPDTGDCDTRAGDVSGNIQIQGIGGSSMNPYLQDLLFLADGDLINSGNNSTTLHGAIMVHEQFDLGGQATYTGVVISESACDSTNSPVGLGQSEARGNFQLTHNGDIALPLDSVVRITAWNEL